MRPSPNTGIPANIDSCAYGMGWTMVSSLTPSLSNWTDSTDSSPSVLLTSSRCLRAVSRISSGLPRDPLPNNPRPDTIFTKSR